MSRKKSWTKRLRLSTVVISAATLLLVGNIARWLLSPSPALARAGDRSEAKRLEASARGVDARENRPPGDYVSGNAVIEPADREVLVAGAAGGRIAAIHVSEGQFVERGALLVELESDLERTELAAAEAEIEQARAELLRVRRGNRAEEVAGADAEHARASALAALAADRLRRAQTLYDRDVITEQELAERRHEAAAHQATADRAKAQKQATRRGFRSEVVAAAKSRLDAARARADRAEAALDYRKITAPSPGEVLQLKYRVGEYYRPGEGEPLLILGDTRQLRARVDVYERDVGKLQLGARTIVRAPAYPGEDFVGEVVEIGRRMGRKNIRTDDPTELNDTKILEVVVALEATDKLISGQRVVSYLSVKPPSR